MARRGIAQTLVAAALFGAGGCSLAVDTADVDRGCADDYKMCGTGHCVSIHDPAYGCTRNHCEPCELTNAIPDCAGETCVVKACLLGFSCPNQAGCPVNIFTEADNCGSCGHVCAMNESCRDGACVAN